MKALIDIVFSSLKWITAFCAMIISGWLWLDAHFDQKVRASEQRVFEKVDSYRREDMAVIKSIKDNTDKMMEIMLHRGAKQ